MPKKKPKQSSGETPRKKHKFFLNPYTDCAFTKCPKCETKTKVRKFILVIHIKSQQLFLLNKQCKYCAICDLIIAKKQEIESLMAFGFSSTNHQIVGNDYLVMGTIDRKDWQANNQDSVPPSEIIKRMFIFQDEWNFEVIPAGWYPNESK